MNTASRMESHGVPGRVQLAASTWAIVAHAFEGEDRGDIDVKGKGLVRTYLVDRRREPEPDPSAGPSSPR